MNIYLITRPGAGYDEAAGFVVIAETRKAARSLIAYTKDPETGYPFYGSEGPQVWTDQSRSDCTQLGTANETSARLGARIVLRDLTAG